MHSAPISTLIRIVDATNMLNKHSFLATGLKDLDVILGGGLMKGSITVIAGPASSGKTDLALNIARNLSAEGGNSVVFLTYDNMTTLTRRLITSEIGSIENIRSKETDMETVENGLKKLNSAPLSFLKISPVCFEDMVKEITTQDADVIIVDSIQQLPGRESYVGNREQELSDLMRLMNETSRLGGKTLIIISEVSRTNKTPLTIHDLKDSSSIEFESDNVIMLEPYEPAGQLANEGREPDTALLQILKAKESETGEIIIKYEKALHRFSCPETKQISSKMNDNPGSEPSDRGDFGDFPPPPDF